MRNGISIFIITKFRVNSDLQSKFGSSYCNIRSIQKTLEDMALRPEFAHYVIDKIMAFDMEYLSRLFEAGDQAIQWDGTDGSGRPMSAGAYIALVEGEHQMQTVKLMMVK